MVVVIACIWFSNNVLDGQFLSLGPNWVTAPHYGLQRNTTLAKVFPLETRCDVMIMGSGGGLETYRFKCILAPNSITRYVFLLMWFWYALLLFVNSTNVLLTVSMMGRSYWIRAMYLIRAVGSRKVLK